VFEHFATAHEKYKGGENKKKKLLIIWRKKTECNDQQNEK
jgi:hypothetical protein